MARLQAPLRFLGTIVAICAVACATLPNVVTVVKDYVPVIMIDNADGVTWLGQTRCDVAGHPFILLNPRMAPEQVPWIVSHEKIHVAQSEAAGGCERFVKRYMADSLFRLQTEATAFCQVYKAQLTAGASFDPPLKTIVWVLHYRYASEYTEQAVEDAISGCR